MTPDELLEESRFLRTELRRFTTRRDWLLHPHAERLQGRLSRLLSEVHHFGPEVDDASGPGRARRSPDALSDSVRYVHWNILHGNRHQLVLDALQNDAALRDADLIALNEVDIGMRRSGNVDVGRLLARQLGLHGVWCALFLELLGGDPQLQPSTVPSRGETVPSRGEDDREALFGLCLLSRHPLTNARRLVLESPSDLLFDREGKAGNFVALHVTVQHPVRPFDVVVTHLDVHGTPARRMRQMQQILEGVPAGPMILSGDLNTTTFERGTFGRSLRAFAVLALSSAASLRRRLLHPDRPERQPREPVFGVMRRAGLEWDRCNDGRESLDLLLEDVQEVQRLPGYVRRLASPVLQHVERRTRHRLDWIAARGLRPLEDPPPVTRVQWMRGARPASDHAPLACTFRVSAPGST